MKITARRQPIREIYGPVCIGCVGGGLITSHKKVGEGLCVAAKALIEGRRERGSV